MAELKKEIFCQTAKDFLGHLSVWSSEYPLERFIFRGHSDSNFDLLPTALRFRNQKTLWFMAHLGMPIESQRNWEINQQHAELEALRRFYRLADRSGLLVPAVELYRTNLNMEWDMITPHEASFQKWLPTELLELAGLAQHYGLPTRLLDWTYDPMVACYFAAHGKVSSSGRLDVWALNHEWLSWINGTVEATELKFVTPPYFGNPNLAAQKGVFSVWSEEFQTTQKLMRHGGWPNFSFTNTTTLDARLEQHFVAKDQNPEETLLLRFSLPEAERDYLKETLLKMDYGRGRLFPGYGGVVDQLRETGWTDA